MSDHVPFWGDEDGGAFVEVADYPDQDLAGQGVADDLGMIVGGDGKAAINTRDCECYPTTDACPDDPEAAPCRVRERVVVWSFESFEADVHGEAEARDYYKRVWFPPSYTPAIAVEGEPERIPVVPGQVEAGL